jgi:hypothetical protein
VIFIDLIIFKLLHVLIDLTVFFFKDIIATLQIELVLTFFLLFFTVFLSSLLAFAMAGGSVRVGRGQLVTCRMV